MDNKFSCDDCKSNILQYSIGYILKDFTRFTGDTNKLPKIPDRNKFWVSQDCKKNSKGLKYLNLTGECEGFERNK